MTGPEETHDGEGQMAPGEVDDQTVRVRSSQQGNNRQEKCQKIRVPAFS